MPTAPPVSAARKILFLPGAGGSARFWEPVAHLLPSAHEKVLMHWPGLGDEPAEPGVLGFDDLVQRVIAQLDRPCDLVAQSLGGVVAMRVALAVPGRVRSLVLTATSGGVPLADLSVFDWRPSYRQAFPNAAPWICERVEDLSAKISQVSAPTLLLWGESDPISPPAVGERLRGMLPHAALHVLAGADHDLGTQRAVEVSALIAMHLQRNP